MNSIERPDSNTLGSRSRRVAAFVALSVLASGCSGIRDLVAVDRPAPKVAMKGYPVDLAFGEEPAAPTATVAPAPRPLSEIARDTFEDLVPSPRPAGPAEAAAPVGACPPPGPGAVAERAVSADVVGLPEPGVYPFKQQGSVEIVGIGPIPLAPLTSRIVRHVGTPGAAEFEVELFTGTRRQVQRYRVVPGDGIFVVSIVTTAGENRRAFTPLLPVEVFPLPVTELTAVSGAGVDPLTGEAMIVNGTVTRKQRVDGCGEVVDGWLVEATWTFQRAVDSQVYDIDYTVATQHGGLVIADHIVTVDRFGTFQARLDVTATIGSIHPRPETTA